MENMSKSKKKTASTKAVKRVEKKIDVKAYLAQTPSRSEVRDFMATVRRAFVEAPNSTYTNPPLWAQRVARFLNRVWEEASVSRNKAKKPTVKESLEIAKQATRQVEKAPLPNLDSPEDIKKWGGRNDGSKARFDAEDVDPGEPEDDVEAGDGVPVETEDDDEGCIHHDDDRGGQA
jgi:hypothetical protein